MKDSDLSVMPATAPPRYPVDPRSATDQTRNGIGESLVIKGELSASEDLIVRGQVEGSISMPDHTLTVDVQASVAAKIAARAVVVVGSIRGPVTTGEKLEIRPSGSVIGDVTSPRLIIVDGGSLRGKVEMPRT